MKLKNRRKLTEAIQVQGADLIGTQSGYDVFDIRTFAAAQQFKVGDTNNTAGAFTQNESTFNSNINDRTRLYFFVDENTNKVRGAALKGSNTSSTITLRQNNTDLTVQANFEYEETPGHSNIITRELPLGLIPGADFTFNGNHVDNINNIETEQPEEVIPTNIEVEPISDEDDEEIRDDDFDFDDEEPVEIDLDAAQAGLRNRHTEQQPESTFELDDEDDNLVTTTSSDEIDSVSAEDAEDIEEFEGVEEDEEQPVDSSNLTQDEKRQADYYVSDLEGYSIWEKSLNDANAENNIRTSYSNQSRVTRMKDRWDELNDNQKAYINAKRQENFEERLDKYYNWAIDERFKEAGYNSALKYLNRFPQGNDLNLDFIELVDEVGVNRLSNLGDIKDTLENAKYYINSLRSNDLYKVIRKDEIYELENRYNEVKNKTDELINQYNINKNAATIENLRYKVEGKGITILGVKRDVSRLEIPEIIDGKPVTKIASYAFYDVDGLRKVTLPKTVKMIERGAFLDNYNLEPITISKDCIVGSDNKNVKFYRNY